MENDSNAAASYGFDNENAVMVVDEMTETTV